jgi:hypothetical protein
MHNYEQNYIDLGRILMGLNDQRRRVMFDLCEELLGTPFTLRKAEEDNDLSMRYVEVDGQNISVASSGARLLITIVGLCMDERFSVLLIDEPELGLSPRVQEALATLFQDPERRAVIFPHLKAIFISTHSHLFLSRDEISDNFIVTKKGNVISADQVTTTSKYHRLQFNLLGNSLESLFLPAAIVVVEGKCDFAYLDRVIQVRFPDKRITVIQGSGDVKRKIHGLREAFGDLAKSPFRSRLFAVLDSIHQLGLVGELEGMGLYRDNVIVWEQNGIEYVYPEAALRDALGGTTDFEIDGDRIRAGDIVRTKNELCERVVPKLDADSILPTELETKLLARISSAIA